MVGMIYLRTGTKYRVIYSIDGGETYYQSTGKLVHVEGSMIYLDLRPAGPVAKINKDNLVKIEAVKADTVGMKNERWYGPVPERSK